MGQSDSAARGQPKICINPRIKSYRLGFTRERAPTPRNDLQEETYDGVHHIAPTDLPEYNRLVRARVLTAIRNHPLWYAGIVWQRVLAIQRDATPAALSLGSMTLAVPGAGWLAGPVLLLALWRRKFFHATLILFALPLSAVALLVYSAKGMTAYGIAHLIAVAVGVDLLVRARWPAIVEGRAGVH